MFISDTRYLLSAVSCYNSDKGIMEVWWTSGMYGQGLNNMVDEMVIFEEELSLLQGRVRASDIIIKRISE